MLSAALVFAGALVALGSVSAAPALADGPTSTAAYGTPTIDGQKDAVWDTTTSVHIAGGAISADYSFLWDGNYLYAYVDVQDSTPCAVNPPSTPGHSGLGENDDAVELWINWLNDPSATYDGTAAQHVIVDRNDVVGSNFGSAGLSSIKTAVVSDATHYVVEEAIPWSSAVRPGATIGINPSIDDDSNCDGARDSYITADNTDEYWNTPAGVPTMTPLQPDSDQIFIPTSDFTIAPAQSRPLPIWQKYVGDSGVSYSVDGTAATVDPTTGSVTGLTTGTVVVTASKDGLPDDQLTVNVVVPEGPPGFFIPDYTVPGGPFSAGAPVSVSIAEFWRGTDPATFSKVNGSDWLSVSKDGVLSGTVPSPVPEASGVITVQGTDGTTTSSMAVVVNVVAHGSDHFIVPALTTPTTAAGGQVTQSVAGLWTGATAPAFTKVSGDSWLNVSSSGLVTGTAPKKATTGTIAVKADDGLSGGTVTVEVPVLAPGQLPTITAASWNLWDNGSHVDGGLGKEVAAIAGSGLDVIGVQESDGTGAKALADALGWYSYQSSGDLGIVSAYPISDVTAPTTATPAAGVTITVGSESLRVWTAHLDETAASTDVTQAGAIAKELAPDLAKAGATPVILLGDLVSPTAAGAFTAAGLTDAAAATKSAAPTYSLVDPNGASTRADYVDYRGALSVLGAEAYYTGWPSSTDVASNQWPSDHAAAVSEFQLRQPAGSTGKAGA